MGFTRSRRYANHKSGRKYVDDGTPYSNENRRGKEILPLVQDPVKAESAKIFYERYVQAREDVEYKRKVKEHKEWYEQPKNKSRKQYQQ